MKRIRNIAFLLAAASVILLASTRIGCTQDLKWSVVLKSVRAEYGDVTHITTDSLASRLSDTTRARPVLLDTRTEAEFVVSHLAGAIHVDPSNPRVDELDLARDAEIVTYCSVGYRSSAVARVLQEEGFTNVSNLEGSIFKWANEGRPIAGADGSPADTVHPYNRFWAPLLNDE